MPYLWYDMLQMQCKNHFANVCRSGSGNRSTSHSRDFQQSHVKGNGKGKSQKKKVNEVLEDYSYDYDSEEEGYEIGKIKIHTIHSHFQSHKEPRLNSIIAFKRNIVFNEMTSKSLPRFTKIYWYVLRMVPTNNGYTSRSILGQSLISYH